MRQRWKVAAVSVAAVMLGSPTDAHRLDEYLQATRVSIGRDRIELEVDLTPGITIAGKIAGDIDTDHDGRFAPSETDAYARAVLASLALAADAHTLPVALIDHQFPEPAAMLEGLGTIRLRASAPMSRASGGRHTIEYSNAFRRDTSVYLANALVPVDRNLSIQSQDRDPLQQRLTVNYEIASNQARRAGGVAASLTVLLIVIGARRRAARKANAEPPAAG